MLDRFVRFFIILAFAMFFATMSGTLAQRHTFFVDIPVESLLTLTRVNDALVGAYFWCWILTSWLTGSSATSEKFVLAAHSVSTFGQCYAAFGFVPKVASVALAYIWYTATCAKSRPWSLTRWLTSTAAHGEVFVAATDSHTALLN